jgi:hypothetical protein
MQEVSPAIINPFVCLFLTKISFIPFNALVQIDILFSEDGTLEKREREETVKSLLKNIFTPIATEFSE